MDLKKIKNEALKDFFTRKLQSISSKKSANFSETEKLIDSTSYIYSSYMIEKIKEGADISFDYDFCSSLCVEHGTSSVRRKAAIKIPAIELSSETIECQKFCKNFQHETYSFIDGLIHGISRKQTDNDCTGSVNGTSRSEVKFKVMEDMSRKLQSDSAVKSK